MYKYTSTFCVQRKLRVPQTVKRQPKQCHNFRKKTSNMIVHLMCSVLPHLRTAKRRLRLSSQYSRCKIAGKTTNDLSKLKAPLKERGSRVSPRSCVPLNKMRLIATQKKMRNTFLPRVCRKMLLLAGGGTCAT